MQVGVKNGQFVDELTGETLDLKGSYTFNQVQEFDKQSEDTERLEGNFSRLFMSETKGARLDLSRWGSNAEGLSTIKATPWKADGKGTLNDRYYEQLTAAVDAAADADTVTGVMLFDGAFTRFFEDGWDNHPLNGVKGLDDPTDVHEKGRHNQFQRAHVKRMVQTLEDHGNVVFEVANEINGSGGVEWTKKVLKWIRKWSDKPAGVSYITKTDNDWMTDSGADFIAPGGSEMLDGYAPGVTIYDTDHVHPLRSNVAGLESAADAGRPIWMLDGLDGDVLRNQNSLEADRQFIAGG